MSDAYAYLILGPSSAGRVELIADLIDGGFDSGEQVVLYYSEAESPDLALLEDFGDRVELAPWRMEDARITCETPTGEAMIVFLTDGTANPVDQVEAFAQWLNEQPHELGSVITVVNCAHATRYPELTQWYDACIHFSDCVLLNRRENVPQTWIREFTDRYTHAGRYPCYIEQIKKNRVAHPCEVLDTTPRRISLIFEAGEDLLDEMDFDEDDLPEDPFDLTAKPDPYLERLPGGMRAKVLPDISKYLED